MVMGVLTVASISQGKSAVNLDFYFGSFFYVVLPFCCFVQHVFFAP